MNNTEKNCYKLQISKIKLSFYVIINKISEGELEKITEFHKNQTYESNLIVSLLKTALSAFQCQSGTIAVLDLGVNMFRIVATVGLTDRASDSSFINYQESISGYVFDHQEVVIIDEYHLPPINLKYQRLRDTCSICVPLIDPRNNSIGIISLNKQTGFFSEDKIPFLLLITKQIAIILEEIHLKEEREKTLQVLNLVSTIYQKLHCTSNYEEASVAVLRAAVSVTQATKGFILRPLLYTISIPAVYKWDSLREQIHQHQKYLLKILRKNPLSNKQILITKEEMTNFYFRDQLDLEPDQDFPLLICPICPESRVWGFIFLVVKEKLNPIVSSALNIVLNLAESTYQNIYLLHHNQHLTVHHERLNLARELHDGLTQSLIALRMQLEYFLNLDSNSEKTKDFLNHMHDILNECVNDSRAILSRLRRGTQSEKSIREFIEDKIKRFSWDTNQKIIFDFQLSENILSTYQKRFLIKILQESVINSCKHSSAKKIHIKVGNFRSGVYFLVKDNGKGFCLEETLDRKDSYGLRGMIERMKLVGGTLRIRSEIGKGTMVKAVFPLNGYRENY